MRTMRVVGGGRAGTSLALAMRRVGWDVESIPGRGLGRGLALLENAAHGAEFVVLAVPDSAIAAISAQIRPGPAVIVHLAGSLGIEVLAPHERRSVLHPLAPLPDPEVGADRLGLGVYFAHAGDQAAIDIAEALGGRVIDIADADRRAYHAAACVASNHVVAAMGQAERIGSKVGLGRHALVELARFALDDVERLGPPAALTGPAARGDLATLVAHSNAIGAEEADGYWAGAEMAARLAGRPRPCPSVISSGSALRTELESVRASGRTVGFVPTMGALHPGHTSLIARAATECDMVVTSIFVNPTQFGPQDDLEAYPRHPAGDLALAGAAGTDLIFAPAPGEMYPAGAATTVTVGGPASALETDWRPGHFSGVATVVTRLLALAGNCRVYFGEKDFQQLVVVRRVVLDLGLPAQVVACPTIRDEDGVAMSSRNARLSPAERSAAPVLYRALQAGRAAVERGETQPDTVATIMSGIVSSERLVDLNYAVVVDPASLEVPHAITGEVRLLVAGRLGTVRLLDNMAANSPAACGSH